MSVIEVSKEAFLLIRSAKTPKQKFTDAIHIVITLGASTPSILLQTREASAETGINLATHVDDWGRIRSQRFRDKIQPAELKEQLTELFVLSANITYTKNCNFQIDVEFEDPDLILMGTGI
jgi:hypothetical protein